MQASGLGEVVVVTIVSYNIKDHEIGNFTVISKMRREFTQAKWEENLHKSKMRRELTQEVLEEV